MSTLTGRTVATTYKDLLQISNQNAGIDGDFRYIEDGEGTISVLALSTSGIQIAGHVTPSLDQVYDLGSSNKRFRDLWLSGNSIHIGDTVFTSGDVQAVKDVQTTSVPVSTIAELASTSVQPGDPISFSTLINRPVTLEGYGITDGATQSALDQTNDILTPVQSVVVAGSANWNSTHNSVYGTSGSWDDTHTTVKNNSGDWFSPGLTTLLQQNSGTWNNATQPDTDVQFNDLTVTGHIAGPATLTIDPAAVGDNTGRVVIAGDLQVDGVTTTVNSTTMTVSGKTITLAEGATDPSMTDQSGIHVDHVDANILYDSTTDTWRTNRDLVVQDKLTAATLSATGHVVVDGTVDAAGDLKVQGDSVVTQSDVGAAPNQIPQNKDLGSLAYQDAAQIEDLTVDTLELRGVAAELQSDAVDVFVYDTRRDSDGGEWRERTSHTSWYNEELNTAIRGGRREFPAVAVIVAESDKVTIYDGDDPDLPMWMVINQVEWNSSILFRDVVCVNATMVIGNGSGITVVNFINNKMSKIHSAAIYTGDYVWGELLYNPPVLVNYGLIIHNAVNDVAMTVLPGAPVDVVTGLPVPTIAVATDGGVSVIKHDGGVVDISSGYTVNNVDFTRTGQLCFGVNGFGNGHIIDIPSSDTSQTNIRSQGVYLHPRGGSAYDNEVGPIVLADYHGTAAANVSDKASHSNVGLTRFEEATAANKANTRFCNITNTYNTGWIHGDVKLATLSDTTAGTISNRESELFSNTEFDDESYWDQQSQDLSTINISNGTLNFNNAPQDTNVRGYIKTEIGREYVVRVNVETISQGAMRIYAREYQSLNWLPHVQRTTPGVLEYRFTATVDRYFIYIYSVQNNQTGTTATVDHATCHAVVDLLESNGNFDDVSYWSADACWTISNGQATSNGNSGYFIKTGILTTGRQYLVSCDVTSYTSGVLFIYAGAGAPGNKVHYNQHAPIASTGSFEFLLDAHNADFGVYSSSFVGTVDNVRVTDVIEPSHTYTRYNSADPYYRQMKQGLTVHGTVKKEPVAPGAELMAYTEFWTGSDEQYDEANNYLYQPFNGELNFGTDDFSIMFWLYPLFDTHGYIYERSSTTDPNNNRHEFFRQTNGKTVWHVGGGSASSSVGTYSDWAHPLNTWGQHVLLRKDGVYHHYYNGELKESLSGYEHIDHTDNDAILTIGSRAYFDPVRSPFFGKIALFRMSGSAPTDTQITKMYHDEFKMFQAGARVTLDGPSAAVTAHDYDDKTDLLHVGTSHGRSVFKGLCRVDSTDQPVTTAISSYDELIVEQ